MAGPEVLKELESAVCAELVHVGIDVARLAIEPLASARDAYVVTVVSEVFDGATQLDRELRVRPAVARAFRAAGRLRAALLFVLRTQGEVAREAWDAWAPAPAGALVDADDAKQAYAWHEERASVLRALAGCGLRVEAIDDDVVVVVRPVGPPARMAVAFAPSAASTRVEPATLRALDAVRASQPTAAAHHLTMTLPAPPVAGEAPPPWLTVERARDFLHRLNASRFLADTLARVEPLGDVPLEARGPVVEPAVRHTDGHIARHDFFESVRAWMLRPRASLLVVVAPGGHGKSTLLAELTRRQAVRHRDAPAREPVPLAVSFDADKRGLDFPALIQKTLTQLGAGRYATFAELLRHNEAVLFVDGFDELVDDAGFGVAEARVRSMRGLLEGSAKILLACRSILPHRFVGDASVIDHVRALVGEVEVELLELLPFGEDQVDEYVGSRVELSIVAARRIRSFAHASPEHGALSANPLFLRLLTSLASGEELPAAQGLVVGVDFLIESVCNREEARQRVGVEVAGQLEYLEWLASESFRLGHRGVDESDAESVAAMMADAAGAEPELAEALMSHALLVAKPDHTLAFLHPLVRDVLLGRKVMREIAQLARSAPGQLRQMMIDQRDLPMATIRYLALGAALDCELPPGWLGEPMAMSARVRRNLFRIAFANGATGAADALRWQPTWAKARRISALDLSELVVAGAGFDGVSFQRCNLEETRFVDCSLRGARFDACRLVGSSVCACALDNETTVGPDCVVRGVEVRGRPGEASVHVNGVDALQALLRAVVDGAGRPSARSMGDAAPTAQATHAAPEVEPAASVPAAGTWAEPFGRGATGHGVTGHGVTGRGMSEPGLEPPPPPPPDVSPAPRSSTR